MNLQYEEGLSCAQWFAFSLMYSNTQFRTKNNLNSGALAREVRLRSTMGKKMC